MQKIENTYKHTMNKFISQDIFELFKLIMLYFKCWENISNEPVPSNQPEDISRQDYSS